MDKDEALRMALEALEYPLNISHEGFNVDMAELLAHMAITAIKEALAQPEQEPVAWRETYGKIIKALAGIVTVHTPDKLFDLDAIPRDPVMHLVQQIRAAIYGYAPPQHKPLTDEEIGAILEDTNAYGTRLYTFARAIEVAHNIKE